MIILFNVPAVALLKFTHALKIATNNNFSVNDE